jgi:Spy/CpxP family protein refolding chaperone
MKRTLITILILTVATAAVAAPPRPSPGRGPQGIGGPGDGPGGPGPRGGRLAPAAVAEFLNLSDAQVSQYESLRQTLESAIVPLREQKRANGQAMEEALAAGNSARAGELAIAGYNLRQQMKAAHDAFKTSFEAMLTAEQKAKWAVYEELNDRRGRRGDRPE